MGTISGREADKRKTRGSKFFVFKWAQQDSNLRPADYEPHGGLKSASSTKYHLQLSAATKQVFMRLLPDLQIIGNTP